MRYFTNAAGQSMTFDQELTAGDVKSFTDSGWTELDPKEGAAKAAEKLEANAKLVAEAELAEEQAKADQVKQAQMTQAQRYAEDNALAALAQTQALASGEGSVFVIEDTTETLANGKVAPKKSTVKAVNAGVVSGESV